MVAKKVGDFLTGTMNSNFFVTGQVGMKLKFGKKRRQSVSSVEPYRSYENFP